VANLLLARGAARQKEVALRLSLGATRARLVRQALTESILLVVAGGALGVWLAAWGQRAGPIPAGEAGTPFGAARFRRAALHPRHHRALRAAVRRGPALRSTAVDPAAGLRAGSVGQGAAGPLLRRALVVAQVAFSVVLVGAGRPVRPQPVRPAQRGPGLPQPERGRVHAGLSALECGRDDPRCPANSPNQLQTLPGVSSVSYGFPGPFLMGISSASIRVPGSERTAHEPVDVETAYIAPRYFETIGTPLVARPRTGANDTTGSRKVAVVNEAFVREFLPGEKHPDSRTFSFDDSKPEGGEPTFIVGVVRDIRHAGIQQPAKPTVYVAIDQGQNSWPPTILVRTQAPPNALLRPSTASWAAWGRTSPSATYAPSASRSTSPFSSSACWPRWALSSAPWRSCWPPSDSTAWWPTGPRGAPARSACGSPSAPRARKWCG
jgi:putative ABC transport system permease protein